MSTSLFRYKGRVVDGHGDPVEHVVVALVDEDLVSDDLMGATLTAADGTFEVCFGPEAFNQEALEREAAPDLYVVLSVNRDDRLVAVARRSFAGRRLGHDEDLGDLALTFGDAGPEPLAGQEPLPGFHKRARRLSLDDELLARAFDEAAPVVESLTGHRGLRASVRVVASDGLGEAAARMSEQIEAMPTGDTRLEKAVIWLASRGVRAFITARMRLTGIVALYDPYEREIVLDRPTLERVGYDCLRAVLGHELVHASQFLAHPALVDEYRSLNRELVEASMSEGEGGEAPHDSERQKRAEQAMLRFSANVEGHATHLERDFLRNVFSAQIDLPHAGLFEQSLWRLSGLLSKGDQTATPSLLAQEARRVALPYDIGLAAYRARARDGKPAPFDPAFRPAIDG